MPKSWRVTAHRKIVRSFTLRHLKWHVHFELKRLRLSTESFSLISVKLVSLHEVRYFFLYSIFIYCLKREKKWMVSDQELMKDVLTESIINTHNVNALLMIFIYYIKCYIHSGCRRAWLSLSHSLRFFICKPSCMNMGKRPRGCLLHGCK